MLAFQHFDNLEVISEAHGLRVAGDDGLCPYEQGAEGIELAHLAILERQTVAHGAEEGGCLGLVAHRETSGATSRTAHHDGGCQLGRRPAVGRQLCLIFAFGQQTEGTVHVVLKESRRGADFVGRHMVEHGLDLRHRQLQRTVGWYAEGPWRLPLRRGVDMQARGGHHLLYLQRQVDILLMLGGVGKRDVKILARVVDIEQHLRRQHLLYGRYRHDDFLGKERPSSGPSLNGGEYIG